MTNPFDPLRGIAVLLAHDVQFVMIGGLAGRMWGSPTVTNDLDVCHDTSAGNLRNLSAALTELEARLRGVDGDVAWSPSVEALRAAESFTLATTAGNLDLLARPAGTTGYDDVATTATEMDLGDLRVLVADVEDLIRMKRATGRPKDLIEVEVLGAVLEELDP